MTKRFKQLLFQTRYEHQGAAAPCRTCVKPSETKPESKIQPFRSICARPRFFARSDLRLLLRQGLTSSQRTRSAPICFQRRPRRPEACWDRCPGSHRIISPCGTEPSQFEATKSCCHVVLRHRAHQTPQLCSMLRTDAGGNPSPSRTACSPPLSFSAKAPPHGETLPEKSKLGPHRVTTALISPGNHIPRRTKIPEGVPEPGT